MFSRLPMKAMYAIRIRHEKGIPEDKHTTGRMERLIGGTRHETE